MNRFFGFLILGAFAVFASCSKDTTVLFMNKPLDTAVTHQSVRELSWVLFENRLLKVPPKKALTLVKNSPKLVVMEGYFVGHYSAGYHFVSNFSDPLTPGTWTFMDRDSTCIYVMGGEPENLNLFDLHDRGEAMLLNARIHKRQGRIYLEYIFGARMAAIERIRRGMK